MIPLTLKLVSHYSLCPARETEKERGESPCHAHDTQQAWSRSPSFAHSSPC